MRRITRYVFYLSCCLFFSTVAMAQTHKVSGTVTDADGQPIGGASVLIKGTQQGTTSGNDGSFSISANPTDVLVISSVDFSPYTVKVGAKSSVSVKLAKANSQLSEVVVTALGIKRQAKELGYSTTAVKSSQLTQAAVVNTATGLAAKISGVDIRLADNGVNPQVKVTFRGTRSISGNNEALIVVDGVPVDQSYLANLNPTDIEDVTILKGANASALYGTAASNGVMIITTKKGKGNFSLTYTNTVNLESISYFPAMQSEYSGYGGEPAGVFPNPATGGTISYQDPFSGQVEYAPFENENFGQAFNSLDFPVDSFPIGQLANGQFIFAPFKAVPNGRENFFQTGIGDQNKLSGSIGKKWGGLYFSGEHTTKQGVVPKDTYERNGGRINADFKAGKFSANGGISYNNTSTNQAGNSYDQARPVYWSVMNQQPDVDLSSISNLNLFQNNQGYINAYFPTPWWQVNNARSKTSTNQLVSNLQLNYKINNWISLTARGGYSRTSEDAPSYLDSISFDPNFFLPAQGGPWGFGNLANFPGNQPYQTEDIKDHYDDLNLDGFATITKKADKFKFNLILGANYRSRNSFADWNSNQTNPGIGSNVIPSGSTKITHADGSADATYSYSRNDQSVYGDLTIGYDNWLFLHASFRNDWTSILALGDRSFNYPAVDMSAVLSEKLSFLKKSNTISYLKIRASYANTGNVSLDGYQHLGVMGNIAGGSDQAGQGAGYLGGYSVALPTFGAYAIYPITSVGTGFPYGSLNGYSQSYTSVQQGLKPEKTASTEVGFQLGLLKNRINLEGSYYYQNATNQTLSLSTSVSTGIAGYLTNAGTIANQGVELDLALTPLIKARDFKFDLSGNFSYQDSKVTQLEGGKVELDQMNYGTTVLGGIYAVQGKSYAQIYATDYERDPKGRVIVNGTTGLPIYNPNPVDYGNTNYKYFLGISPTFSYKNFTFKTVWDYRGGAKILHEEASALSFAGISTYSAQSRSNFIIPNSVINTGTNSNPNYVVNSNVPIISESGYAVGDFWWANYGDQVGSQFVTSAAFWKLREASLTYDIPKKCFKNNTVIKGISISAIGRNLLMWRPKTNQFTDPEFSTNANGNAVGYTTEYQTPPTRIISFSITANLF
jgi:TonB-linked SusC/RagA family outer membrane protein